MAYAKGELIKADDLGKSLTNNTAEVANYKIFAITITATAYNKRFTFLFNANNGNSQAFTALAPTSSTATTWSSSLTIRWFKFTITLTNGINFSAAGCFTYETSNLALSIDQIRGLM